MMIRFPGEIKWQSKYLPRWMHYWYAKLTGQRWYECDECDRMFGSHERINHALGRVYCPWCTAEWEIKRAAMEMANEYVDVLDRDDYYTIRMVLEGYEANAEERAIEYCKVEAKFNKSVDQTKYERGLAKGYDMAQRHCRHADDALYDDEPNDYVEYMETLINRTCVLLSGIGEDNSMLKGIVDALLHAQALVITARKTKEADNATP